MCIPHSRTPAHSHTPKENHSAGIQFVKDLLGCESDVNFLLKHTAQAPSGGGRKTGSFHSSVWVGGCGWFCRVGQPAAQGSCDLPNHPPHILTLCGLPRGCHPLSHSSPEKDDAASCLCSWCGQRMASQEGWSTLEDERPLFPVLGLSCRQTLGMT